jgi:hypothetical protein
MPKKVIQKVTAWSFTRLSDFEQCPLMFKLKHIEKIKEPTRPCFERGKTIEQAAYAYITTPKLKLPISCEAFNAEFAALKNLRKVFIQQNIAFDCKWKLTDWFDPKCWLRVQMDIFYNTPNFAQVVDLKTGKIYEDKIDQLDLYNLAALHLPMTSGMVDVTPTESQASMWYLDQGETRDRTLRIEGMKDLKEKWCDRVAPMFVETKYEPTPTHKCRWCPYRKGLLGKCEF